MDPHRVLGVDRGASKEEIKAAFRKAALLHHPDRHSNATEAVRRSAETTFRSLNEAYQTLTDGSYRYRAAQSPGRAGFRRSGDPAHNHGSSYYAGYSQHRRQAGFASGHRSFVSSGSMLLTAVLGGVFLAGLLVLEPLTGALWAQHNAGKRFSDVDGAVAERRGHQLAAMRAARRARWEMEAAQRALHAQRAKRGEVQQPAAALPPEALPLPSDVQPSLQQRSSWQPLNPD